MQGLMERVAWLGLQRGVELLNATPAERYLASGIPKLDRFLGGGIAMGTLSEWGLPPGCDGRRVILAFLAHWCCSAWAEGAPVLWVSGRPDVTVYPPAWEAGGVDLRRIYFAEAEAPVAVLRPVFLERHFPLIVLDAPRRLRPDAQAFLATQARRHDLVIFLLRPYFLSSRTGNVWAKSRFNCRYDAASHVHVVHVVRGRSPGHLAVVLEEP